MGSQTTLELLASQISSCRRCDSVGIPVIHPAPLYRGLGRKRVLVVGVQPGNTEKTSGQAFSGNAGTRLIQWLVAADLGTDRDSVFQNVYFTSVVKCASKPNVLGICAEHCFPWLEKQVELVRPQILVTLGKTPLELLFECRLPLEAVVGKDFRESQLTSRIFPLFGDQLQVIPFPHPSGMSRWHNEVVNKKRIHAAIALLKSGGLKSD